MFSGFGSTVAIVIDKRPSKREVFHDGSCRSSQNEVLCQFTSQTFENTGFVFFLPQVFQSGKSAKKESNM